MNKNNDIQRMIELFMAGQTSIEEEQLLAEYFRGNTVPEEWQAYKEMFSYFDEGMPEGRYASEMSGNTTRRRIVWLALAAAAAVALLFVMTWQWHGGSQIVQQPAPPIASVATDTTVINPADTVLQPAKKPMTTTKKRKNGKYKYRIAPPKTYYAMATNTVDASVEDSISHSERLIAADLRSAELLEQLLLHKIELIELEQDVAIALASDEDILEDEGMEEAY